MMNRPGVQPSLPSLFLCCHTDVVPANESLWTQPAFEGTLVDGKIFGRGAQDMKSVGVQVNRQSDFGRPSPTLHNVYIGQFFSSRPRAVRHILKSSYRHTIQHIFVPTRSVERNIEKI